MKNKEFNGFASEAQYEAVFDAIKKLVYYDDYETFMVSRDDNEIKIFLDDIEITIDIYEDSMRVYCDREMGTNEIEDISDIYLKRSKICNYVAKYDEEVGRSFKSKRVLGIFLEGQLRGTLLR